MPSVEETLLVFTDLDGTLLDFHTLDWQPAAPWLEKLMDEQVPVILSWGLAGCPILRKTAR